MASAWKGVLDVDRKVLTRTGSIMVLGGVLILATLLFGAASAHPVEAQAGPTTYTVQPGDTLSRLANRYGVTVDALVAANEIEDRDLIRVGQVLTIPASTAAPPTPVAPASGVLTYTVQPGDTLARLATRYGVTVDALVEANEIEDRDLIRVGQVLLIAAPTGPLPTLTPSPRPAGGPLQLDWALVEWRADDPDYIGTIRIEAQGGQPPYTYYHDGLVQEGPTFEMAWRRCRPKPGSVAVSDATGVQLSEEYWLEAPYCPVGIEIVSPEEGEHLKHYPRHFNLIWEHTVEAPPPAYGIEIEVWQEGGYGAWQAYRHERGDKPLFFVPDTFPGDLAGRVRMWGIYEGLFDGPKTPWREFEFRVTY
jgi:LysM repeat protein